jgi:hypothetical protein
MLRRMLSSKDRLDSFGERNGRCGQPRYYKGGMRKEKDAGATRCGMARCTRRYQGEENREPSTTVGMTMGEGDWERGVANWDRG